MKSILAIFVMASLAAYGQKIETQKADRMRITRLATTLNHLSVIELNEPVKEVAVGSSNFKVECARTRFSYSLSNPTPPRTCSSGPHPGGRATNWFRLN